LNNINILNTEIILSYKKTLLEGCTTNVLFVSRNKIYSPVKNIYEGTTLKFFKRKIKTIKKKDISLDRLAKFDEIILIGSGKGVVSVNSIDKPYWRRKSLKTYRFLSKIYQQAITNCPLYNG
jgi:branched-subunit amino acid aminotransferase/4-amino-4-deoxychorismate lyase